MGEIPGMSCMVDGTIPPSAGLSSSSGFQKDDDDNCGDDDGTKKMMALTMSEMKMTLMITLKMIIITRYDDVGYN